MPAFVSRKYTAVHKNSGACETWINVSILRGKSAGFLQMLLTVKCRSYDTLRGAQIFERYNGYVVCFVLYKILLYNWYD